MFGAYIHTRPNDSIFYVGKGTVRRARYMVRNSYHDRVVEKYGRENIGVGFMECSNEDNAFELEKGLIKCLRRSGIRLTNMTDGGEGGSGYVASPELIARRSASNVGRKRTEEQRARISAAVTGRKLSEEQRASHAKKMTGRKASEETKAKMREAAKGKKLPPFSDEHRANLSKAHVGISNGKRTPEQRAYMASKMKGIKRNPFSEESRANMAAAQVVRRENEKLKALTKE